MQFPLFMESKIAQQFWVDVKLPVSPSRLDVLEPGWQFHPKFPGALLPPPTPKPLSKPPRRSRGYDEASGDAKRRWRQARFPTGLEYWADEQMIWPIFSFGQRDKPDCHLARLPSVRETECGLGYAVDFSVAPGSHTRGRTAEEQRLSALSKSSCVPVISRVLVSILVASSLIQATGVAQPSPLAGLEWPRQRQPDVLEDLRSRVELCAEKYKYLVRSFKDFLVSKGYTNAVVGPDPGLAPETPTEGQPRCASRHTHFAQRLACFTAT